MVEHFNRRLGEALAAHPPSGTNAGHNRLVTSLKRNALILGSVADIDGLFDPSVRRWIPGQAGDDEGLKLNPIPFNQTYYCAGSRLAASALLPRARRAIG